MSDILRLTFFLVLFLPIKLGLTGKENTECNQLVGNFPNHRFDSLRTRRQIPLDPRQHLDDQIDFLLANIPYKIRKAKEVTENLQHFKIIKRVAQGWSIVAGSWLEILSDILIFNRTSGHFGGMSNIYNYAVKGFYGVGFGFPLLLGLPESNLPCSEADFHYLINKYHLRNGVKDLIGSGMPFTSIQSAINEFDILIRTYLGCLLDFDGEIVEAAEVTFSLDDFVSALQLRIGIEVEKNNQGV